MTRTDRSSRRGIFIITTLMVITFLVILSTTLLSSALQNMASAGSFDDRELALHAAMAGLTYVQARVETNAQNFSPDTNPTGSKPPNGNPDAVTTYEDGQQSISVSETGWNIFGIVNNQNVVTAAAAAKGEQVITSCFRVTFQKNYTTTPSTDKAQITGTIASGVASSSPPEFVSFNNLTQPASLTGTNAGFFSFDFNNQLHQVPAGTCDVIVEGFSVRTDGTVRARRVVEGAFSISQYGNFPQVAAVSQGDLDINLTSFPGGNISVGPNNDGLASQGNVNFTTKDGGETFNSAYTGPPVSLNGGSLTYTGGSGGAPTSAAVSQKITPPTISAAQLPPLQSGSNLTQVQAGTWAVWNGGLFHYPTSYQTATPSLTQPWTQTSANSPPLYNGVATDTSLTNLAPNGAPAGTTIPGLFLDPSTNTLVDGTLTNPTTGAPVPGLPQNSSVDVQVKAFTAPAGTGGPDAGQPVNSFAFVVPPQQLTNGTQIADPTDTSSGGSLNQRPSAQVFFGPQSTNQTPQLQSPGSITIVGNVAGQGSVEAGVAVTGDLNVIGKSSVDPKPDSGVGLFATGSVTINPLDPTQSPVSRNVISGSPPPPVQPPSGGIVSSTLAQTSATVSQNEAIDQALQQLAQQNSRSGSTNLQLPLDNNGNIQGLPPLEDQVKDTQGVYVINGQTFPPPQFNQQGVQTNQGQTVKLKDALADAFPDANPPFNDQGVKSAIGNFVNNLASTSAGSETSFLGQQFLTLAIPPPNSGIVAALPNSQNNAPPPAPPPAANTTTTAPVPPPPPDQSFGGLAYANNGFTVQGGATNSSIQLSGILIVSAGGINLNGSNISLQYNPNNLSGLSGLVGNQVTLVRTAMNVF